MLLKGTSGTGKTTVLDELARRGHRVVDTDDPGWSIQAPTPDRPEPLWDPFGSTTEDRAKITNDLAEYEPFLRAGADHEIVTTAPIPVVVRRVEELAAAVR